jgi:hypothetical protein
MKWFFEKYKKNRMAILTVLAMVGTPTALVVGNVLEVADATHDEARATLGKSPVPEPAPAPAPAPAELPAEQDGGK